MSIQQFALSKVSCASCVRTIERALEAEPSITDYSVNFAERTASIETDAEPQQIIEVIVKSGYGASIIDGEEDLEAREAQQIAELKQQFQHAWIALGLGALLMLQMMLDWVPPLEEAEGRISGVITAVLTLVVMRKTAAHIYRGAWSSAQRLQFNMDTLIALGTGAAWIYSSGLLIAMAIEPGWIPDVARHLYYEATLMIIGFILLGQALETRGRTQTASALRKLMHLQPKQALRVREGEERMVNVQLLLPGDLVRIRPGERVPVDAAIVEGETYVDESMLSGEPVAVSRRVGDRVTAGTQNQQGSLLVKVTEVGSKTRLAQIMDSVRQAQNTKPELGRLADRVASVFVPIVMLIALLTYALWTIYGPEPSWSYAILAALTVLIVACPCALGLATPMAVMVGVGRAADLGVLIRQGDALQRAQDLTTVVLDKTGTLTEGSPSLVRRKVLDTRAESQACALAQRSEHPLARALAEALPASDLVIDQFKSITGGGVKAEIDGQLIHLGNERWLTGEGIDCSSLQQQAQAWAAEGCSLVWLADAQRALALFALNDAIRADSEAAIDRLHRAGLKLVLLSGDHELAVKTLASRLKIDSYKAGLKPEDKLSEIRALQQRGEVVAMVGDGINDAPALAQADVGYAMGGGTDVAIESADVVLMQNSLQSVANAILLSRATVRNIKQNLFGAFIYNTLAIPVAAGVLFPFVGVLLNPMIAGAAMALSSVTVVANARRLAKIGLH
ncbi:MAG TPA: heavy metal translocating P-type ATPase [Marinobacterium sp.]|nr:heavy metal translocating P-type ATPase [Marinobacterium sp.]